MKLQNNTVLITGGTSGIGLTLGRTLQQLNNRVILLGRNQQRLTELQQEGFETIACDLSQQGEIEKAVIQIQNEFPQVNMLFNNAGIQHNYDFIEEVMPLNKIAHEINVNVTGQLLFTQLMIPILSNAQKAFIINTTSGLGAFPKDDGLVYSASKAAMRNFTIGLRYRLKASPIKVMEFIPPVTDTGMTKKRDERKMSSEALVKAIIPQLQHERSILTIKKMRVFLWISFLFPSLANKILTK